MTPLTTPPAYPQPMPRPAHLPASLDAICRAFANRLTREAGEDAIRLADATVAQVRTELRGQRQ